jgi:hypothetical protein
MIPEGTQYFITKYGKTTFYKEELVFERMKVLFYWNVYETRWMICGHHPWDELVNIEELSK